MKLYTELVGAQMLFRFDANHEYQLQAMSAAAGLVLRCTLRTT
ncbi:MAG TPA: hypothetical protein VMH22_11080 [bacterium]|nr:hypothetical protein [bacterium]